MRTVAIIQARMGSTRLPGKVMHDLCGDTMLARGIERIRAASSLAHVVIATTTNTEDDVIVREARRLGVQVFRGSSDDVLARYHGAAHASSADAIVRVTSDCPLIDPGVVDRVVAKLTNEIDYASNTHDIQTFPRGLDCEVFHRDTLDRMARMATSRAAREHVTVFVRERPDLFRTDQLISETNDSDLRWTVDTDADLALVRELYERFSLASRSIDYREIVRTVRAEPALRVINAHIAQKDWRVSAT
jgi:spore coat polysaccharide biosynthesis protein SpsF